MCLQVGITTFHAEAGFNAWPSVLRCEGVVAMQMSVNEALAIGDGHRYSDQLSHCQMREWVPTASAE